MDFQRFFQQTPLIGMVHLPPLPGSPRHTLPLEAICQRAVDEARMLECYGMDAVLVENYGDVPFYPDRVPPITVAALTCVARAVREAVDVPVGINVLRNDAVAALSIAAAVGAQFIRVNVHVGAMVTDQGILQGRAHETLRLRRQLQTDVGIFADVCVKHAAPLASSPIAAHARDALQRGLADALIVTGGATGEGIDLKELQQVRDALPEVPLLAGSGVTAQNLAAILRFADGAIVGTWLKRNGQTTQPVDPRRVRALVAQKP